MKRLCFLYKFLKVHITVYYITEIVDLNPSATKVTALVIWQKPLNEKHLLLFSSPCFGQKLYEKTAFFNTKVISRSAILETFRILNFLLLKWWPFQYDVKFQMNTCFSIVLMRLLSKVYEKTISFQYKVSKSISVSSILSSFLISNLLLKWWFSQYIVKTEKNAPWVLFSLVFCEQLYE